MARRRPTQEERKAKTRERLLDSAERVCRKRGYHAASVEEIAGRAGYSTGAVYAHFHGKDDLVLAVVERRLERQAAEIATATADRRGDDRLAAGAELWTAVLRSDRDFIVFFVELWAVAVRDRALRVRLAAANRRIRSASASSLRQRPLQQAKRPRPRRPNGSPWRWMSSPTDSPCTASPTPSACPRSTWRPTCGGSSPGHAPTWSANHPANALSLKRNAG